jgi:hypothetical protein
MPEEKMTEVFIPALVAMLVRAEELAERPLTKDEVLRIRDDATVVVQPLSSMPEFLAQRGYHDLYPPEAWEEWQLYREGKLDLNIGSNENT